MDLTSNSVVNIPGVDDREMDKLIALRAACQIVGAPGEVNAVSYFVHEFKGWLKASISDADRLVRRYVLLLLTQDRKGFPDRESAKLRKLIDDIYRECTG